MMIVFISYLLTIHLTCCWHTRRKYTKYFNFNFGPELEKFKGPIKSLLSVSQSVCLSVRYALFSELAHYFFLIFSMKLGDHRWWKVTEPDFSWKFVFGQKGPKRAKNGPKMTLLDFSQNCVKRGKKWPNQIFRENSYLAKNGQKGMSVKIIAWFPHMSNWKWSMFFHTNFEILDPNLKSSRVL